MADAKRFRWVCWCSSSAVWFVGSILSAQVVETPSVLAGEGELDAELGIPRSVNVQLIRLDAGGGTTQQLESAGDEPASTVELASAEREAELLRAEEDELRNRAVSLRNAADAADANASRLEADSRAKARAKTIANRTVDAMESPSSEALDALDRAVEASEEAEAAAGAARAQADAAKAELESILETLAEKEGLRREKEIEVEKLRIEIEERKKDAAAKKEKSQAPRDLVQIRVRVVEVARSNGSAFSSVLDYRSQSGQRASLVTGNNIHGNQRTESAATRFGDILGLIGLDQNGTAIGGGKGLLVNLTGKHVNLLASFLASELNADTVTAPQVVTLNENSVEFFSGEKLPFRLGTNVIAENTNTVREFFYKNVGAYVKVTPTIIAKGAKIRLNIVVRVADSGTQNLNSNTVNFESGIVSVQNLVELEDNRGLVMGGLISEREIETEEKIPILGDLPLVGALFKDKTTDRQKTETLVFVEARKLAKDESANAVLTKTREDFILGANYVQVALTNTRLSVGLRDALEPAYENFSVSSYWNRFGRRLRRGGVFAYDVTK